MPKSLRFWGTLCGLITAGGLATWGLLLVGRPASALPVQTAKVEQPTTIGINVPRETPSDSNVSTSPIAETPAAPAPATPVVSVTEPEPAPREQNPPTPPPVTRPLPKPEPPTGTALPADWAKGPELHANLVEAFHGFPGTWSVAVLDLTTGYRWSIRGEERYHPASTIKLPVTLYAMTEQKAGRLKWSDVIQYTEADFESPGGGAFETAPFGGWYPVENLVNRSLIYSNNVAVNMLGRHLGWQNIRNWTKTIGGELFREADASPSTTVLHELAWWRYLYQVSLDDPQTAALVLDPLRQVTFDGRIAAGLPSGVPFVHKFGSLDPYFHDGGIVWAEQPYAMVIMTGGAQVHEADTYIPLATAAIHKVMGY